LKKDMKPHLVSSTEKKKERGARSSAKKKNGSGFERRGSALPRGEQVHLGPTTKDGTCGSHLNLPNQQRTGRSTETNKRRGRKMLPGK